VLRIAHKAEAKLTIKQPWQPWKVVIAKSDSEEEAKSLENLLDSLDKELVKRT